VLRRALGLESTRAILHGTGMKEAPIASVVSTRPPGFWRRRVLQPIRAQLTQGVSPDQIAATLAVGTACSVFPIFGVTSLVNLGVGISLRMNQPILQTLNQLLGPVQVALILVYVRIGEVIWRSAEHQLTVAQMMREFRERSLWDFLQQFSWAGVHALTAWIVTSPVLVGALYFSVRPAIRRAARRRRDPMR
jgi:uncharacterized protein (DUF2062 family)